MSDNTEKSQQETRILDGQQVDINKFNEAQKNQATRIVEDANNPGQFKTLHRVRG